MLGKQDVSILNASCCCLLGTSLHELYERRAVEGSTAERKEGLKTREGVSIHAQGENVGFIRSLT